MMYKFLYSTLSTYQQHTNELSQLTNRINNFIANECVPSQQSTFVAPSYLTYQTSKQLARYCQSQGIKQNVRIIHALAHIQFNAFLSYLHSSLKFQSFFHQHSNYIHYQNDMLSIARDQARHFLMLQNRLKQLGFYYGRIPAIKQLNNLIQQTQSDILGRLGIISILHQGKGIIAIKRLINLMMIQKDYNSAQIMKVIQSQETNHYSIGLKWFKYQCQTKKMSIQDAITHLNAKYKVNIQLK